MRNLRWKYPSQMPNGPDDELMKTMITLLYLCLHTDNVRIWLHCGIMCLSHSLLMRRLMSVSTSITSLHMIPGEG